MTTTLTANIPSWAAGASEEVREYVRTYDLDAALTATVRLAETALPTGSYCTFNVGEDPESDETWLLIHLVINVPRSQVLDRLEQFVDLWVDSVTSAAQCRIHFTYSAS